MATRYVKVMSDDLDGDEAAETFKFGVDGLFYEIDLSLKNLGKYRELFAPLVAAGRRLGKIPAGARPPAAAPPSREAAVASRTGLGGEQRLDEDHLKAERKAAREWARGLGLHVADRGALRHDILMGYRNRHADPAPAHLLAEVPKPAPVPAQSNGRGRTGNGRVATKAVPKADFQPAAV